MALPIGHFKIREFSWAVVYEEAKQVLRKVFYKIPLALDFAALKFGVSLLELDRLYTNKKGEYLFGKPLPGRFGKIEPASWQVCGTLVRDGKKVRLKPVFNNYPDALDRMASLISEAEGAKNMKVQDLIPAALAKDVLNANLPDGWSVTALKEHAHATGFNPNYPRITVDRCAVQFVEWLTNRYRQGQCSRIDLRNKRYFLVPVGLYFGGQVLQVLLDKQRVRQFCEGEDPINGTYWTVRVESEEFRARGTYFCLQDAEAASRELPDATIHEQSYCTRRPWKTRMQFGVAAAISGMLHWAADGRYLSPLPKGSVWFPELTETDPYVMSHQEVRDYLNAAWPTAPATRTVLALFGALRPDEISSPGSYLILSSGQFVVDNKRKTGARTVLLPPNARIMLQILHRLGRLHADEIAPGCFRIRNSWPSALTVIRAKAGYRIAPSVVTSRRYDFQKFRTKYPEKYGEWVQDGPRHTCLVHYFHATGQNAGATSGYAGHLPKEFFKSYCGKIVTDNMARTVVEFYRIMPETFRHLETAKTQGKDVIPLPFWFAIQEHGQARLLSDHISDVAAVACA